MVQIFGNNQSLRNHVATIHENLKPYSCQICGENFSLNQKLKRHTETVHEEKTQKCVCDLCGKEYSHKSALKDHIAKAHIHISKDDCVTECDKCKKSFDQVIKFNNHLVVCSSDPKDFKCRQCDKGGLISESFSLWLKSPKMDAK